MCLFVCGLAQLMRSILFAGELTVETAKGYSERLNGTHRVVEVACEHFFVYSTELHHNILGLNIGRLNFFYRIENCMVFSVELTIIFMNDLEIFYRCLCDTSMKVEHVRLGLFVPNWRFVAQLDQIGHIFALPFLDYRAVIL